MPGSVVAEGNPGKRALLLVDAQQDFLERPGLSPYPVDLIGRLSALLNGARACGWPVLHVRTRVSPDHRQRKAELTTKGGSALNPSSSAGRSARPSVRIAQQMAPNSVPECTSL